MTVMIIPSQKFHSALDGYSKMHHFVTEICTHVHIAVTKWCMMGLVHRVQQVYSIACNREQDSEWHSLVDDCDIMRAH